MSDFFIKPAHKKVVSKGKEGRGFLLQDLFKSIFLFQLLEHFPVDKVLESAVLMNAPLIVVLVAVFPGEKRLIHEERGVEDLLLALFEHFVSAYSEEFDGRVLLFEGFHYATGVVVVVWCCCCNPDGDFVIDL